MHARIIRIAILLVSILGGWNNRTYSQEASDSNLIERFLLDFVVPDMPAFKALGTDPSNILRPADVKKFSAMLSPFYSEGKGVIPKNFALEFAPWKLSSKDWTLSEYNANGWMRFRYRSSFSLGTVSDSAQLASKISFGYRVSFLSQKADIYRAAEIRNYIFSQQQKAGVAYTELTNYWVINIVKAPIDNASTYYRTHQAEFNEFLSTLEKRPETKQDTALMRRYNDFIATITTDTTTGKTYSASELKEIIQTYGKDVDTYIDTYKKKNWNASRLDVAIAWVGQSGSGLLTNVEFGNFAAWITGALRVHQGGQLLLGLNAGLPRSTHPDSTRLQISGNLRYYLGTQDFRGFFETQYKYNRFEINDKSLLFNLGAEFRLGGSFWIVASTGIDNYLKEVDPVHRLVSSLDVRYGFNKSK